MAAVLTTLPAEVCRHDGLLIAPTLNAGAHVARRGTTHSHPMSVASKVTLSCVGFKPKRSGVDSFFEMATFCCCVPFLGVAITITPLTLGRREQEIKDQRTCRGGNKRPYVYNYIRLS
eukprot:426856-Amphidinium_carterae.7